MQFRPVALRIEPEFGFRCHTAGIAQQRLPAERAGVDLDTVVAERTVKLMSWSRR
jgi:hypothetical protein